MPAPEFEAVFAADPKDVRAAQRLRYDVFVDELGGDGPMVDHTARLEQDEFDEHAQHLLLLDHARGTCVSDCIVGAYRLMDEAAARAAGRFYSEREYDVSALTRSGQRLLELGRSCLHKDYRGGPGLFHMWSALSREIERRGTSVLFGVASFHGTDVAALAPALTVLHNNHLAPAHLQPIARTPNTPMPLMPMSAVDKPAVMRAMPSLIKAYLRLGGGVGQGAYLDHAFNTTDVCLVLEVANMSARQKRLYGGQGAG